MLPIGKLTGAITHPARTAGAVAGAAIGASVGAATAGMRTTARVLGWAFEHAGGPGPERAASPSRPAPAPEAEPTPAAETAGPARKSPATKAPAKKSPAKKAAAKKSAAKKTGARKAPSKKAAVMAPALGIPETEIETATGTEDELRTPSGIPAAGEGINPDTTETDLHQPGTEPLVDPATVKAVASESEVLRRGADRDKG